MCAKLMQETVWQQAALASIGSAMEDHNLTVTPSCSRKRVGSHFQESPSDNDTATEGGRPTIRARQQQQSHEFLGHELCMYVKWSSSTGQTREVRLPLQPISSVDDLSGLCRRLIFSAFPDGDSLPDYLVSSEFVKFTPVEDFVSLPGDTNSTNFRLVAVVDDGREVTLAERELGGNPDPARNFLITAAEFESDSVVVEGVEVSVSLVSYPTVCVKKDFLAGVLGRVSEVNRRGVAEMPSESPSSSQTSITCRLAG